MNNIYNKMYKELIIKNCLLAVFKALHRNSTNNEYYIDTDDFEYKYLSEPMVNLLKDLVEEYYRKE